ncbi:MAG: hypothetical protein K6E29_03955 [Cyanobacteria bacterium RUI128]|nr:hypothetical protein [Cyanobacteria bacterium RUI128]
MNVTRVLKNFYEKSAQNVLKHKRKSQYLLLEKTEKLPIESFKESNFEVPEGAVSYTLVTIGKKKDPEFKRQVVTFYDNAYMIQREIQGTDYPKKVRNYIELWKIENGFRGPFTRKRDITTKQMNPQTNKLELRQEEQQFVYTDISPWNYIYPEGFRRTLHINKNVHDTVDGEKIVHSTITEYPSPLSIINDKNKVFSADISFDKGIPKVKQINEETNVDYPKNDKFLPYRLLVGEQKEISIERGYLKHRGLDKLNIDVRFSPNEVSPNAEAMFDCDKSAVIFKKVTKGSPVEVAVHEGEHAYQYSLCGRLGKNTSRYGLMCQKELPELTDVKQIEEGFSYVIAAEKYPKTSPNENLRNNREYWYNELEVRARKKSKRIKELYNKGKEAWHELFPVTKGSNSF